MALDKQRSPLSFQSAVITIASFLALGGYGYYRQAASDNSLQEIDLQSKRRIERLEKQLGDLEKLEKEDYERIEALETRLEEILKANTRGRAKPTLDEPAKEK